MVFIIALLTIFSVAKEDANPWGKIRRPVSADSSQIHGSYTSGCLTKAEELPLKGIGFTVANPYRNRYYGHPSLVRLIKNLGMWAQSSQLGSIVVGDMAQPAGGPLTGAHKSHQIGLDADIRLHLVEPKKKIKNANQYNSIDVVSCRIGKHKTIDYKFHADKWPVSSTQLLQKIATDDNVERIFVSAGIKKYLCESFPDHPDWLRKIRPEWGHTGHLHVRLRCPMSMTTCHAQAPIIIDHTDASTVGCSGKDYDSWFQADQHKKIKSDCIPKSEDDPIPYWQKVIASEKFPQECLEITNPKKSTDPIKL